MLPMTIYRAATLDCHGEGVGFDSLCNSIQTQWLIYLFEISGCGTPHLQQLASTAHYIIFGLTRLRIHTLTLYT